MGLERDVQDDRRKTNPTWRKAFLDSAVAVVATTAVIAFARVQDGAEMYSLPAAAPWAVLALLLGAAFRRGVSPGRYWRRPRSGGPSGRAQDGS